ncbi:MAG: galactose oxidase-like domain-containing protein [Pseudomonadota bacterium]
MAVTATSGSWNTELFSSDDSLSLSDVDFNATPIESGLVSGSVDSVLKQFSASQDGGTYAARFTATVTLDEAEDITFHLAAAGDARVLIDDEVVAELSVAELVGAGPGPCPTNGAVVCTCKADARFARESINETLEPGEHTITIEYLHQIPEHTLAVEWAVGDLGRRPLDLVVPEPVSANDLDGGGEWGGVIEWPGIAIHSILLPDGRVLTFGTPEDGSNPRDFKGLIYDVWDPETGEHTTLENMTETDIFCSALAIVPETGEVLVVAGDGRPLNIPNRGINDTNIFDPDDNSLTPNPSGEMEFGRWYPTALTLANGKILVLGGRPPSNLVDQGIPTPELFTPGEGYKTLNDGSIESLTTGDGWFYTRAWLASDGKVVVLGNFGPDGTLYKLDPSGTGGLTTYGELGFDTRKYLPAINYATDKALFMDTDGGLWSVDFSGAAPVSELVGDVGPARSHSTMDILADGTILITGGGSDNRPGATAYHAAIVVDPTDWSLAVQEEETLSRLYHSSSLLLRDGTVITMGGGSPGPFIQTNAEIFRPEYLFDENGEPAERIKIIQSPEAVQQMDSFVITVDDASAVERITMLKHGSTTHAYNMGAGFIEPEFSVDLATNTITITPPENPNVFIPGSWMVFALDANGTPSEAISVMAGLGGETHSDALGTYLTLSDAAQEITVDTFQLTTVDQLPTEDDGSHGTVATNARIDFTSDFTLDLQLRSDAPSTDESGIAFVFHNADHGADETGESSTNFGTEGLRSAFGIQVDLFGSGGAQSDQIAFFEIDSVGSYGVAGTEQDAGALDDGAWHDLSISWDFSAGVLTYSVDGSVTDTISLDPDEILRESAATLAITAGADGNAHEVRFLGFEGLFEGDAFREAYSLVLKEDWKIVGDARLDFDGEIILTSSEESPQSGAATIDRELDLTSDFEIVFDVTQDDLGGGGFAFVLHTDADGAETLGEGPLAADGIAQSLVFDFPADEASGTPQTVALTWDASERSFSYQLGDGTPEVISGADVEAQLGGTDRAYLTVTAAKESGDTEHRIGIESFDGTFVPEPVVYGLSGKSHFYQPDADTWHTVNFDHELINPIVVMSPLTMEDETPANPRVRNVTSTGFEYQIDTWDYSPDEHVAEEVWWMAVEEGVHITEDGGIIEAGRTVVETTEQEVTFEADRADANVVVMAQTTSVNDPAAVTDRVYDVSEEGFSVLIQEEEAADNIHAAENLDWIAFSTGAFAEFSAGTGRVDEREIAVELPTFDADDVILADIQQLRGVNPSSLRLTDVSDGSIGVVLQEEQSQDEEMLHFLEEFGWVFVNDRILEADSSEENGQVSNLSGPTTVDLLA